MSTLPYICPDHPKAKIRHDWDQNHYILNEYPAGTGWESNHKYSCSICGLELCKEKKEV